MTRPLDFILRSCEAVGANAIIRRCGAARLLIVCYHGVCADDCRERHWLLLRRSRFAEQLDYLRSRFDVQPLDEAVVALHDGRLREPTAAITFDDGYENNYTEAWPELRLRRLPATIFLTTGLVSTEQHLWTTVIEFAIRRYRGDRLDLSEWQGPSLPTGTAPDRDRAGYFVKEWLKTVKAMERAQIMDTLADRMAADVAPPNEFRLMTWQQVQDLAKSGLVRFGAHSVHHEILSRLDDGALEAEIRESVEAVLRLGGAASRVFAFPNGRRQDFDERALVVLGSAGIRAAVTTRPGMNSRRTPVMLLRRLVVSEAIDRARFAAEAGGAMSRWPTVGWW